jgi:cell wall assembly regulator SMI1
VAEWQVWTNQLEIGRFNDSDNLNFNSNKVKTDQWWGTKWIPIAWRRNDNYCLDLYPSLNGRLGQIIEFSHEFENRELIGDSFIGYFKEMVENLENETFYLQEDEEGDLDFNFKGFNKII